MGANWLESSFAFYDPVVPFYGNVILLFIPMGKVSSCKLGCISNCSQRQKGANLSVHLEFVRRMCCLRAPQCKKEQRKDTNMAKGHKPGTIVMTKEERRITTLQHARLRSSIFILSRKIREQGLKYT